MKRRWFQDKDGTFYRNCPLILGEQKECIGPPFRGRRFRQLQAEWEVAWRDGVIRKAKLGRGDKLVPGPAPFREAYPDNPGLWVLDEED